MARPVVARFEVTGKDSAGLRRFYSELFGWSIQEGAKGLASGWFRRLMAGSAASSVPTAAVVRVTSPSMSRWTIWLITWPEQSNSAEKR